MSNREKSSSDWKWYSKPIFSNFWNHYKHCNQWLEQNGYKVIEFSDDFEDNNCHNLDINCCNCLNISNENSCCDRSVLNGNQSKMDALEAIDENECNLYNKVNQSQQHIGCEDKEELDISDEYLKFVMETKKHQTERKKLREKRLRYNDRVEYIDISRLDSFSRKSVAPKRDKTDKYDSNDRTGKQVMSANELKRNKMFELYGEDYNVIQGMEAALQLNFDRLCDLNQPKFWPIMPIRITSNVS